MAYKNFKKAEIIDEIGSELRKARNAKELTLAQVADNLEQNGTHVSGIMLGRIENGQRRIDDTLLHALCELYHIDSNDLTINACQSHITALQQNKCPANSAETDVNWFLDTALPVFSLLLASVLQLPQVKVFSPVRPVRIPIQGTAC